MYFHIQPLRKRGVTYRTNVTYKTRVEINDNEIPVAISTTIDGDKDTDQIKKILSKAVEQGFNSNEHHDPLSTQTTLKVGDLFFKVSAPTVCSIKRLVNLTWASFEKDLPNAELTYDIGYMEYAGNFQGIECWNYPFDFSISYSEEHDLFDVLREIMFNLVDAERNGNLLDIRSELCGDISIELENKTVGIVDIAEALYPIYQGE